MRPLTTILCTIAGLFVFSVAALLLAPLAQPRGVDAPVGEQSGPAAGTFSIDRSEVNSASSVPQASRSPETAVDRSTGLERVAPREPLSQLGQAQPPQRPEIFRLFRPVAPAAGRIEAGGQEIVVAGIDPVDPGQDCEAADGTTWPCGMRARTAFRLWLRGRAIDCKLPDQNSAKETTGSAASARCALDGDDVGQWLVENGWAPASADGPYGDLEKQARKAGKGLFGDGPARQ